MSLMYGTMIVANARVAGMHAIAGIGISQLRFSIEFSLPNWEAADGTALLRDLRAEVSAGQQRSDGALLGFAVPEVPLVLEPKQFAQTSSVLFLLNLTDDQLYALDKARGGGGLQFRIVLTGTGSGKHGHMTVRDEIRADCSLPDWSQLLKQLHLKDILVIGIEMPKGEIAEKLGPARDNLLRAHEDLVLGRYDDVVSRCRKVLDSLQAALNESEAISAAVAKFAKGPRRDMTKLERELLVAESARHYSHPAHHVDDEGASEWYSRDDATFIVALTAAVFKSAAARQSIEDCGTSTP